MLVYKFLDHFITYAWKILEWSLAFGNYELCCWRN